MRVGTLLTTAAALTLAGCAAVPKSGPTAEAVLALAAEPATAAVPYAFAPLTPAALDVLDARRAAPPADLSQPRDAASQRLRVGDLVTVTIYEAVEGGLFSASAGGPRGAGLPPQRIGSSGLIRVPYAGRIRAAGLTAEQVAEAVEAALEGKAIEPQALVTVTESPAGAVTVIGDAARAARVPLADVGERVLDVIAAAGGAEGPAHRTLVRLTRDDAVAETHLARILREPGQNVRLRAGDVVALLDSGQSYVVLGAAARPARVQFSTERVTLDQAIAEAGGLDDDRAAPASVFVFRYEDPAAVAALTGAPPPMDGAMSPVVYNLDLRDPTAFFLAQRFEMADRDIVYVANAPLADAEKVLRAVALAFSPVNATLRAFNQF